MNTIAAIVLVAMSDLGAPPLPAQPPTTFSMAIVCPAGAPPACAAAAAAHPAPFTSTSALAYAHRACELYISHFPGLQLGKFCGAVQ